ncbi:MAG: hypothetical protein OEY94_02595, partial [Alphaproteobacteria bacterium]|nr:hypothetical protein [Alphaproteobacteria bacterium]
MSESLGAMTQNVKSPKRSMEDMPLEPSVEIKNVWEKVHGDMRQEFGEAVFRSWLKPLTLQAYYHGTMEVSVPTRFMRDWIQNHYAERISAMCSECNAEIKRVQIVVVQNAIIDDTIETQGSVSEADSAQANKQLRVAIEEISSPLDVRFRFE